jgi:hypothetical protein
MNFNAIVAMEPPFELNHFNYMWHILSCSWIFTNSFLEYFKLVEFVVVRVLRNVEDERTLSTFLFTKLKNGLNEHFPTIVSMFSQPFFILKNFRYDVIFEEGKKAKVGQSKA